MTEILLTKEPGGLTCGDDENAYNVLNKIATGSKVLANIKDQTRRSVRQHKFFFSMLGLLFENQSHFKNIEQYRTCLLVKMGYCDVFRLRDGTTVPVAWSLKFGSMPNDVFVRLVDDTLSTAEDLGFDRETLLAEVVKKAGDNPMEDWGG